MTAHRRPATIQQRILARLEMLHNAPQTAAQLGASVAKGVSTKEMVRICRAMAKLGDLDMRRGIMIGDVTTYQASR